MMLKKRKLTKIIYLSGLAGLSGTGVSAVIACGSSDSSGGSTPATINFALLQQQLDDDVKIYAKLDTKVPKIKSGVNNLPTAPIGYKWQMSYKDEPEKVFSRNKRDYEHGKEVNIDLVSGAANVAVGVTATKQVIQVVDTSKIDLSQVQLYLDGFNDVPPAPTGTHWIYKIGDEISKENDRDVLAGATGSIFLAADDSTYQLSEEKESATLVATEVVNVQNWDEQLKNVQVLLDESNASASEITDLPGTGETSKVVDWGYEIISGTHKGTTGSVQEFGKHAADAANNNEKLVQIGDRVQITVKPKGSYSFSDGSTMKEIDVEVKTRIDTDGVEFTTDPQAFTTPPAGTDRVFTGLPTNIPNNTYWQISYLNGDGSRETELIDDISELDLNTEATVTLMPGSPGLARNHYGVSKRLTATSAAKDPANTNAIAATNFNSVVVLTTGVSGLPPLNPGLKWQYKLGENGPYIDPISGSIETETFKRGDNVIIHLALDNDNYAFTSAVDDHGFTAATIVEVGAIKEDLENRDGDELPRVEILTNGVVKNLPTLKDDGLVWIFKGEDGKSHKQDELPQLGLQKGDGYSVSLAATDNSYRLSEEVNVSQNPVIVKEAIDVDPADNTALNEFEATNDGISGLPPLKTQQAQYRYKVGREEWTNDKPTPDLLSKNVGADLQVQIVAKDGYGFTTPPTIQRSSIKITGLINFDFEEIKKELVVFDNPKNNVQTNLGLPPIVSATYSKTASGTYSNNVPSGTKPDDKIFVKLAITDQAYKLPDGADAAFETTVKHRIDIDSVLEQLAKPTVLVHSDGNSLQGLDLPPKNAVYKIDVLYIIGITQHTDSLGLFQTRDTKNDPDYNKLEKVTIKIDLANENDTKNVFADGDQLTWTIED